MKKSNGRVLVIGAGMAGSDAAFFLAERGVEVVLVEGKRIERNPAQKMVDFAELVCTNSLKSVQTSSAHGLLKQDMDALGSLILREARKAAVPAGDALAVDREIFSRGVTESLESHPNIQVVHTVAASPLGLQDKFNCDYTIVATGPLTSKPLEEWMVNELADDDFYFYDAIAPVVDADTLDYSKLYFKDRHKQADESADYLNAPMNQQQYEAFVNELIKADKVPAQNFEEYRFFESCLPVDLMAERGIDTPRFSCMKPIGLELEGKERPYAVVQLRKENLAGAAYNLVGFQNRLKYGEQLRVFRMIPGLENASFNSLGSVHRNSFLNSRKLLHWDLSSKKFPTVHFAGQITGVEGYTESASMGLYVGYQILRKLQGRDEFTLWPKETAIGALVNYIMTVVKPVPSNINFGLLPAIPLNRAQRKSRDRKKIRKQLVAAKAAEVLDEFINREML